jgi:ribonuclease HII
MTPTPAQQHTLQRIAEYPADIIIGVDEVGLGCIAGPITVGAVVAYKGWSHKDVRDSKKLTHNLRQRALPIIAAETLFQTTISKPATDVDSRGRDAVWSELTELASLQCLFKFPNALIVQDGEAPVPVMGQTRNILWMPKADVFVPAVSAASIVAKEHRDAFMVEQSARYPGYGFEEHKGYGTENHLAALRQLGPCPLHRKSFKPVAAVIHSMRCLPKKRGTRA